MGFGAGLVPQCFNPGNILICQKGSFSGSVKAGRNYFGGAGLWDDPDWALLVCKSSLVGFCNTQRPCKSPGPLVSEIARHSSIDLVKKFCLSPVSSENNILHHVVKEFFQDSL